MPELPEIEVLKRELAPRVAGSVLRRVYARRSGLRNPFPDSLLRLHNAIVSRLDRRGKYLVLDFIPGTAYLHLGMSGQLRWVDPDEPPGRHDHLDLVFARGLLRLRDPRRFGNVLWRSAGDPPPHSIASLGPEPLTHAFSTDYLADRLSGSRRPIKSAIMDSHVVVGVGNIYASEALFASGIAPARPSGSLSRSEVSSLVHQVKQVLRKGIDLGGSSMRDYVHADGSLGGFLSQARVYGRVGEPCIRCGRSIQSVVVAGRSSPWCPDCQPLEQA